MSPNKRVLQLATPIFLTNITVPLLGIVDTAVLGHLDESSALAAVAIGATILTFVYWAFGFLRMGTTGLTARAFGDNNSKDINAALSRGVSFALLLAFFIHLCSPLWQPLATELIGGANSPLRQIASEYINIRLWSVYPALINFVLMGWLIGLGNSRWPLLIAIAVNGLNIAGDLWFVLILDYGVAGAAFATVMADYTGLAIGAVGAYRVATQKGIDLKAGLELRGWKTYLQGNAYLFIRTLALLGCISFFTAQGARLGEITLAANAILYQLVNATAFSLDAFAHATESLAGRYRGAKDRLNFIIHTRITLLWSLLFAVACSFLFWMAGAQALTVFTNQNAVLDYANDYLIWLALMPIASVLSYQLDGLFIGTGNLKAMRDVMLLSAGVYLASFWVTTSWANHGLWFAFMMLNLTRSIGMVAAWSQLRKQWFKT